MSYALCLHRWVGNQANYDAYSLPAGMALRVICTPEACTSLPSKRLESASTLTSLDDEIAVMGEAGRLIALYGVPAIVVALNEGDLLNAALIRERWNIPGDDVAWIRQFRDKLTMLEVAGRQTSVAVLPAASVTSLGAIQAFATIEGWPLILKPRYGTASRGVKRADCPKDLQGVQDAVEPMMVQRYCDAPILHVDGWWDGNSIVVATVSRYVNNCADFGPDSPLGSIELDHGDAERRITRQAEDLLTVFAADREIVFHLELFERGDELVFLEIAARVGGAEIPFLWRELRRIDLLGIAWEIQTGASTTFRDFARASSNDRRPKHQERGAWVIARREASVSDGLATLYWTARPDLDRVPSGVYEGAKTRLRLRSFDRMTLASDVHTVFERLS